MNTSHFQSPEAIADAIIADVGKRIVLALPLGLGKANSIANALYGRAAADQSIRLSIFTALTLEKPVPSSELEQRFIGPVIKRLFGGYPELAYAQAQRKGELPPNIEVNEFFFLAGRWLNNPQAQQHYIPANYTHAQRYVIDRGVNVVAQLVARRGDRYSLSCNTDMTLDMLAARREGRTDFRLVAEVSDELPFMPGEADLPENVFSHVLDGPRFPLFAPPKEPLSDTAYAIGLHVARTVPDGGTLQIGIGSIGDAVAKGLILRHGENDAYRETLRRLTPSYETTPFREDAPFAAGLYGLSEMLVDAFLELMRAGILKREVDGAVLDAAFFVGPRAFYAALRDMPEEELRRIRMRAVSFVNELYGSEDEKRRARTGARFVNNAMMATLTGAVVSDGLDDGRVVSGVGGQYNFVAQAFALEDARSVITLGTTRHSDGKPASNIRWAYGHTTIPRHLRDLVVTEYGIADLRGKTDRDAIAAMLAIADSRFQPELLRMAKEARKIEKNYELPASARENTPEHIARALQPLRDAGLAPDFPFGCDFDETEQALIPALKTLKKATASPLALARLAVRGMMASREDHRKALERMGYAKPQALKDRLYAALLKGALRA